MRILLVEDEPDAAAVLARGLRENAFAVDVAADGQQAMERVQINTYDLILLDVLLPRMSGYQVCKAIRGMGITCPVLMLTALDAVSSRIEGLDCGADDYLGKPFDFRELLARIRALLRRRPAFQDPVIRIDDLVLDTRSHRVSRGGTTIELTAREYALLEYLALHPNKVIGRAEISEHVWDETYDPFSNLIEVYMQRLRRKIDQDYDPKLLHTRRGEGYLLAAGQASHV
jgi:DNA-binding response OmpR family regulator